MELQNSIDVSASGLRAQSLRMRVIAENLANADSVATSSTSDPYRRKIATFTQELDRSTGATGVSVSSIENDTSAFGRVYQPGSPAADAEGYVAQPNVNPLIEVADMKAAQRSYEANLNAIESARGMTTRTIDLLK
ncbi:flagellar basal body rod protein FlgC [Novosphingobium profundi]|uniref:flagellar basal body rod protein FlgC n=1 Tax=Novosphingobium profundi TaxID=1774954 RepID=UPI001BDAC7CB|nr:flagellar basal body rod protein FlgC [Novosphingobium profundi]MBT0670543.1 flagellar basal body rod protein FlgC [Novosphingobium profundi]